MSKYTPGPWIVDPQYPQDINGPDGKDIATCVLPTPGHQRPIEEGQANARIIAAAPELLEAASMALKYVSNCFAKNALEKAIAKSEGK